MDLTGQWSCSPVKMIAANLEGGRRNDTESQVEESHLDTNNSVEEIKRGPDTDLQVEGPPVRVEPVSQQSGQQRGDEDEDILKVNDLHSRVRFLADKFKQGGGRDHIDEAIALYREALDLCPAGHSMRRDSLIWLALHLNDRYNRLGDIADVEQSISLNREALALFPTVHPDRSVSLNNLARSLSCRYNKLGGMSDLNEAISLNQEALVLCPPGHPLRPTTLNNLASVLSDRYNELGGLVDLNEAISLSKAALELNPPGHSFRSDTLNNLARSLSNRYNKLGRMEDLNEVVSLNREALVLHPPGHPLRSTTLNNLAGGLSDRYSKLGGLEDLNEAISLIQEALELNPPGHPLRSSTLNNLARCLSNRYNKLGGMEDLNGTISLIQEALGLSPPGHPLHSSTLNNLACSLGNRYNRLGRMKDLDEAISLLRRAFVLQPPGHPFYSSTLNNLAGRLGDRYNKLGGMEDLNDAISLNYEALALRPSGHPLRSTTLNNLANSLSDRYKKLGGLVDLNQAISLSQEALELNPPGHPLRSSTLINLARGLSDRYHTLGGMEDLSEAISLNQEALVLHPSGHPDRSLSLNNLAGRLSDRYSRLGGMEDLNEAISWYQESLILRPPGHPLRSSTLNNLAGCLSGRYNKLGGMADLNEAISLNQEALVLRPSGHPLRSATLNNLANRLSDRYHALGRTEDLNEAISLNQESLVLNPPGHPLRSSTLNDLAAHLSYRYHKLSGMVDLNEAISLSQEALVLRPPGHPLRSSTLNNLGHHLRVRFACSSQLEDREDIFNLYSHLVDTPQMASSSDLRATRAWIRLAEEFQHPTTILAYETYHRLLIFHLAALPSLPRHLDIVKDHTSTLAADAFSACLRNHFPTKAVELLEQGRRSFWNQLTRLRSPVADLTGTSGAEGKILADKFMQLTKLIRNALESPNHDQHNRICQLNFELQKVVDAIRQLPGHSRFLLPLTFSELQQAASRGPIIVINASEHSCDALIVLLDQDPIHIPLHVERQDVRDLASMHHKAVLQAKLMDAKNEFVRVLRQIWDEVVSPIVDVLQKVHPPQSRVWWCPTAEFCFLPLHAAGSYRKGQKKFSDLYISSYTSTLTALIQARQQELSTNQRKSFVAIGQGNTKGERELPSVGAELSSIGQRVDGLTTFTRIEGSDSCISRVTEELNRNDWVHLSCHGIPNRERPFESAFALHDGHFTIEHIMRCQLQHAEFAYLSACHTTVGDARSPDEMIHLAAAMQFAGFRSVIGTMWAVDDKETEKIASRFYEHMIDESGQLDYKRAAWALHKTMKQMTSATLDQRILYIHLGV